MSGRSFGWADDLAGPIDTTPAHLPRPPEPLIDAAARAVPAILANVDPSRNYGEISLVASVLIDRLVEKQHTLHAAYWAVHRLVSEGKLLAKPAYHENLTIISLTGSRGIPGLKDDTRRVHQYGGGFSVQTIPKGQPTPFHAFRVIATDALWAWWRGDVTVGSQPRTEPRLPDSDAEPLRACALPSEPAARSPAEAPGVEATSTPDETTSAARRTTKPKRSTVKAEGRLKVIAALTKHHQYADGGCLNSAPIGNNELARLAGVSKSMASAFFQSEFKGYANYKRICQDLALLVAALKQLNDDFRPFHLLHPTSDPPDKGEPA